MKIAIFRADVTDVSVIKELLICPRCWYAGPLNLANLNRMLSLKQTPKAGASMGQLFLNLQYVPFFRSDAILEASDNPAAAMEAMQVSTTSVCKIKSFFFGYFDAEFFVKIIKS